LRVIFCIGETLREREEAKTFAVIERQMSGGLKGLSDKDLKSMAIAYEPFGRSVLGRRPLRNS